MDLAWLDGCVQKASGSFDRVRSLEDTLRLVPLLRRRFNITRIGDTTRLDRIGIPTMCAVVPDTPDGISVYNGKGTSYVHALCSAVMEAVERQAGALSDPKSVLLRPNDCTGGLDFSAMGMLESAYQKPIEFVTGVDLISRSPILVPLAAVRSPWLGEAVFRMSSSHGLASGNTLLEAVYHALFEHVERHAWAIAHTRAHVRPRLLLEALARASDQTLNLAEMIDDPVLSMIEVPTGHPTLDRLADTVAIAGMRLRLLDLSLEHLPTVILASVSEVDVEPVMCHFGLGSSWSPAHAAIRAVTEAVQSRAVDIQGAREDILRPGEESSFFGNHGRRRTASPHGRWYYDAPLPTVPFPTMPDRSLSCLAAETRNVLSSLQSIGVRHVIVVDLSPDDVPVSVVRVLVPDLESALVDGRMGKQIVQILSA